MPPTFIPSEAFKEGPEKEWPFKLGTLDWDSTRIVFTKRSLIEFLRYAGVTVDPSLNNISKLPRYADFGHLEPEGDGELDAPGVSKAISSGNDTTTADAFKPSRRVRAVPGGAQTFTLGDGSEDVLDTTTSQSMDSLSISDKQAKESPKDEVPAESSFKPSRRVRTTPGGPSSMANLWDDHPEPEAFKPTRRVREGPGGTDSISQIF